MGILRLPPFIVMIAEQAIERRLPIAIAGLLLAFVVRYAGEEHRAPVAARSLAVRADEQPDKILMH